MTPVNGRPLKRDRRRQQKGKADGTDQVRKQRKGSPLKSYGFGNRRCNDPMRTGGGVFINLGGKNQRRRLDHVGSPQENARYQAGEDRR